MHSFLLKLGLGLNLSLSFVATVSAQTTNSTADSIYFSKNMPHDLHIPIIIILLIVQALTIIGLLRSRIKHKQAKDGLIRSQKALEQRVIERTNKLRSINNQLYEEIAKHEITEELLQETQDYLQSMINSMPSILIGVTREGTITQWNVAAEQITGVESADALGKSINDLESGFDINTKMIRDAIDQGTSQINESILQEKEGEQTYIDLIIYPLLSGEISGAVIRIDDVTMRVRFENMMIQNEKMVSLGELAAGMAHEINNPLSAILNGVQNIYRRTTEDLPANLSTAKNLDISIEQVREYLTQRGIYKFIDGIKDAGERSAHIVTNMLEFSRASSQKHKPVNLVDLVEHSIELSDNHLNLRIDDGAIKRINIIKHYESDILEAPCSAAEIQQVILNIIGNAAQSFPSSSINAGFTPTITVTLKSVDCEAKIIIEDNGQGMSDSTKRHLFEPFFTTKDVGKGTGLGLSVSYFIITEHHDGKIEVDSNLGKGSTFTITLPQTLTTI
ncbi:MAG: two-component system sensor histidine kinase NtrB [Cellvibrionaceae bacterium]